MIDGILHLTTKGIGSLVKIKDADALKNDLKADYVITKELSDLSGLIALRCGHMLAVVNAFLITASKHVDYSYDEVIPEQITEIPEQITEQSSGISEHY